MPEVAPRHIPSLTTLKAESKDELIARLDALTAGKHGYTADMSTQRLADAILDLIALETTRNWAPGVPANIIDRPTKEEAMQTPKPIAYANTYEDFAYVITTEINLATELRKIATTDAERDAAFKAMETAIAPLSLANTFRDLHDGQEHASAERTTQYHVQARFFRQICETLDEARAIEGATTIVQIDYGAKRPTRYTVHPVVPETRTVPARETIELRLTRLGAKQNLAALKDAIAKLEGQGGLPDAVERLRMIAWEIECQLNEVKEVSS